jgi:MFS family permease
MAAFMVAYGLFEVPWGLLGDARGGRSALMVVVIGGSLMTAAVAMVVWLPDPAGMGLAFLIVARFLFGAFQAGTFPVLARIIADWVPVSERGGAQGALWMSSRLGGALAPILLIPMFQQFGNWRVPLVLGAALGLVWCVGFWPWFRNTPDETPLVTPTERALIAQGRTPKVVRSHGAPWRQILNGSNPLALCGMYGCLGYSSNFFLFLLANYLETKRHLDKTTTMWLTSLPFGCGVFACVMGGVLSDLIGRRLQSRRWGRRVVGVAGMTIAAAGIVSTLAVTDITWFAIVLCVTFIANDLSMGPAWAAATEIGERSAGALGGTMNMVASFTAAVAALVTGDLFARGDLVTPFLLFGLSYILGALCWLRIDVTEPLGETTIEQD